MSYPYLDKIGLTKLWEKINDNFVAKDGNKVLSDNNLTDDLVTKINGSLEKNENASSATKLATSRSITVDLESNNSASFDGTSNVTPGVNGVLSIANGGTGVNTSQALKDMIINTVSDEDALSYWGV